MRRLSGAVAVLLAAVLATTGAGHAQSLEDLNIQIHGYATQGFLYSTQNNLFTAESSNGSPAWTEAVVNIGAEPMPKLRVNVQGRFFLLGNYGNTISLDYAVADYKQSDLIGFRFGKVKTPWGLFNEIQDVDPSYLFALLPEGIYPVDSRSSYLAHYGGVLYGTLPLTPKAGKVEYRAFAGEGVFNSGDGYFVAQAEAGYALPNNIKGPLYGGAVHWKTPISGLMAGASALKDNTWSALYTGENGAISGTETLFANTQPNFFARYDKNKLMVAAEYERSWTNQLVQFPGIPNAYLRNDDRSYYLMGTYKLTSKLSAGAYYSYNSDHQAPLEAVRYSHDTVVSSRYDFNEFLYAKAEEHILRGNRLGYDINLNPDLKPNTALTVLKLGVSF